MRINDNITAYITNNVLLKNEKAYSLSTQKLSSGFKINKAGDDPSGYAITNRMRAQLKALDRSEINSTTGKSVLETADSALNQITDMIQRMNELAIKAANGTMSETDRATVQDEVDQLRNEIDRISKETQLNGQHLLDGTMENTGYCETDPEVRVDSYNERTTPGSYPDLSVKEEVESSQITNADGDTVTIYKLSVTVKNFPKTNDEVNMKFDYPQYYVGDKSPEYDSKAVTTGLYMDSSRKGSVKICADSSQLITVNGDNGESLTLRLSEKCFTKVTEEETTPDSGKRRIDTYSADLSGLDLTLTGKGTLTIQSGANEEEKIECTLPRLSLERLDIDDLDMTTETGATHAIDKINNALNYVNSARSKIGAYQNRVEQNISYLDVSNENLNTAMSRIKDTDMAEEMTNYTSQQVLTQAATSMLAQANQQPQQALQLLQ